MGIWASAVKGEDTMRHSAGVRLCLRLDVASPSRCSLDCEVKGVKRCLM